MQAMQSGEQSIHRMQFFVCACVSLRCCTAMRHRPAWSHPRAYFWRDFGGKISKALNYSVVCAYQSGCQDEQTKKRQILYASIT